MLSEGPRLGQGSGKVFGNIGGPVTLKIHCKESIVAGQKRSHTISKVQNELPTKAGLDKWNFGAFPVEMHHKTFTRGAKLCPGLKIKQKRHQTSFPAQPGLVKGNFGAFLVEMYHKTSSRGTKLCSRLPELNARSPL